MASVVPAPGKIKTFRTDEAFESWMRKNHAREREVWLRIYKKGSAVASITIAEALDVVLCWGWIDGIRKAFDERSYLQRYTPRRAKSIWSQINREHVARLTKAGRMTPHGQRHVDAAKADGRWAAAYDSGRTMTMHEDFVAALEANPKAKAFWETLNKTNTYAFNFQIQTAKKPETRTARITKIIAMLNDGKALY